MVTSIEILDTAVKIGLGALVSGAAAYFVARLNHQKDVEKAYLGRRRELLEDVAQQIEAFNYVAVKYWALTVERAEYERRNIAMPEQRGSEWDKTYLELGDIFRELASAEAKLLLLGERNSQKLLRDYGDYIKNFRAESFVGGEKLAMNSESQIANYRSEILHKRKALFDGLSAAYK